jgi:4-amino-4-deoxy-L-arabinose transferase-like glycosyltransferase
MKLSTVSKRMWGEEAQWRYLLAASCVLLFAWLGGREIWTQEHRWADIVAGMFQRQDFFHPYLGDAFYYDKPLLSYWLMAGIAKLTGSLSTWALRLPSALAGLLAIWSICRLGMQLKNRQMGFLSGWMLLTTFYFLFWARTSSADMLNMAGSLFAVSWYMEKREHPRFYDYAVFFMIVALTSLCKGLVGAVVPAIAVMTDMALRQSWRRHISWKLIMSMLPALLVYVTPFMISSITSTNAYGENGLYLVYRENILRYFQPFDHQGSLYTYFIYLPVYTLPWAFFFIPAVASVFGRWRKMTVDSRWLVLTVGLLFAFFTLSGSRRSYYVLPMVPFALLMTADWLQSPASLAKACLKRCSAIVLAMLVLLLVAVDYLPSWYNLNHGVLRFANAITQAADAAHVSLTDNNVVMLDAETKLNFYLHLSPTLKNYSLPAERNKVSSTLVEERWFILKQIDKRSTVIITRKQYIPLLLPYFPHHQLVTIPDFVLPLIHMRIENDSAALIPIYTN